MPKVKKQHYVPQFYLRRFAIDDKLFLFDKFTQKVVPTNVRDAGSGSYFYDLPQKLMPPEADEIDEQIVEKALGEMESVFAVALDKSLATVERKRRINQKQKPAMAFFMALQFLRTPEQRQSGIELEEALANVLLKFHPDLTDADREYRVKFNEEYAAFSHAQFMMDPKVWEEFTGILLRHIWIIGVNNTAQPLYTSDNPIVRQPHKQHPHMSYSGLASEGIEIDFPLSPRYILLIYERTAFSRYLRLENKCIPISADNVTYFNAAQISQSYRQIYAPSDSFDLVREVCGEHPEWCSPHKRRWTHNQ